MIVPVSIRTLRERFTHPLSQGSGVSATWSSSTQSSTSVRVKPPIRIAVAIRIYPSPVLNSKLDFNLFRVAIRFAASIQRSHPAFSEFEAIGPTEGHHPSHGFDSEAPFPLFLWVRSWIPPTQGHRPSRSLDLEDIFPPSRFDSEFGPTRAQFSKDYINRTRFPRN